jgi:hypothetical protein
MEPEPHFEAIVTLREGMKQKIVGWRPDFAYKGEPAQWMIWPIEVLDLEGDLIPKLDPFPLNAVVRMYILSEELTPMHQGRLHPGMEFTLNEGSHIIMDGVITKILAL